MRLRLPEFQFLLFASILTLQLFEKLTGVKVLHLPWVSGVPRGGGRGSELLHFLT